MPSLGRILSRTFFWTYERGTWQYDAAVVLILIFVLLTKRTWFHDEPQVGLPGIPGQVQLVTENGRSHTYRVDARALAPPTRTPELENDLHVALQKALPTLHNSRFEIAKIEPERDAGGNVIAYQVEVKQ